jgi:hypothetical protein
MGCQFCQNKKDPLVAQVDKYKLRLSDINEVLGSDPDPQIKDDFINIWVEKHLWLKESQGYISTNEKINKQVKEYENSLIIQEYQQKYIFDKISICEGDIREYYKKYKDHFTAYDDVAYIEVFKLTQKNLADDLLRSLKNSINPDVPSEFELVYRHDYIDDIDKLLFSSKTSKYIGPVKVDNYYYVIVVIEKYSKNSIIAMEHVRSDIIQKLRASAYVNAINKKQKELKDQYNVKIIKNTTN